MNNALLYVITVLVRGSTWYAVGCELGEMAPKR
jgi:hypothetical protein